MSLDRRRFLQMAVTGGFGLLFGGIHQIPKSWHEKGIELIAAERSTFAMGSVISFQVIAETEKDGYEAIKKAENIFRSLERIFSMYDDKSEMARLENSAGKNPIQVSQESLELLTFAKNSWKESNGRFDITIEPAMKRWGFRKNADEKISPPTDKELLALENLIGSDKIEISDGSVMLKKSGMALDTGGIAGGYALDKAIHTMKKSSIKAALINFSGDIHCFGDPLDGQSWPVYIWNPATNETLPEPVELRDEALSTSGSYQNRRQITNEHSWGHMLLPFTAEPIEPVNSVTVVHPSAMMADVWSTALYVGAKKPAGIKKIIL